jgi:hypothetical protein
MIRDRTVARRRTPPDSVFLGDLRNFYYWDSYEAPLARGDLAMHELYLSLFAHHPRWIRRLLILRGWIVRPFGLRATTAADFNSIEHKPPTPSATRSPASPCSRRAVPRSSLAATTSISISGYRCESSACKAQPTLPCPTVVSPHNALGRAYLRAILPFHRAGARAILANALAAGRI